MRKIITKIICFSAAAAISLGLFLVSACSGYHKSKPLDYVSTTDKAVSNGGFAVEKGGYIYFINGKEANTADNTFGSVVKGAIMRISKTDFEARKYSSVQTVVPNIAYSGNNDAGIYVYGDYVYYSTPSTDKNSDGETLNSNLDFKSTKLDGTGTMKSYYVQLTDATAQYRYVEVDGTVYLMYVAKEEDYFNNGSKYTNIHSVNTKTGENTLLAYNVDADSVVFDKTDVTNPRVFYTMKVTDFMLNSTSKYNQVYTVTADAKRTYDTGAIDYSEYFKEVYKTSEDGYDPAKDPKYVNCGTLVLDGIGEADEKTVFNNPDADKAVGRASTYAVTRYQDGVLMYTRAVSGFSTSMYSVKVDEELLASSWDTVTSANGRSVVLVDASNAGDYTYLFDDDKNLTNVIYADDNGFVKAGVNADGEIIISPDNANTYYIIKGDKKPTLLFTEANYIYYSVTDGNGYNINKIAFDGDADDYDANKLPVEADTEFDSVKILDIDCASDWYKPEMFGGQLLFPTQTENMTSYVYIMACDLRSGDGNVMTNAEIKELNEVQENVKEAIKKVDTKVYENLQKALQYAYFTGDGEYIHELAQAFVDVMGYGEYYYWSKESLELYDEFVAAKEDGDWYFAPPKEVNGEKVAANRRDYYYSVLGQMNEADAEAYGNHLKTTYLQAYPESEKTWFQSLSTGAKVGFIIGVCAGGLIVIAAAVVVSLVIVRKRKEKLPEYTKKRIKVDTTDDKNINVYEDENSENE